MQARPLTLGWLLSWALALLMLLLPFELAAGLPLGVLVLTQVELVLLATLGLWLLLLGWDRRLPYVPLRLWLPLLVVLGVLLLSAALAPQERGAALKFALRQMQGGLLALCVADQLRLYGLPLARRLVWALLAGGVLSALLGLAELSESPAILSALQIFKEKPTLMGGLLRLSGSFGYANIAAMYYEALLPFALLIATQPAAGRRFWLVWSVFVPGILYTAALFTYSRASFVTAIALVILTPMAVMLYQRGRRSTAAKGGRSTAAALLVGTALLLVFSPTMRLRLTATDVSRWYAATYAPESLPQLAPNELWQVYVHLTNSGLAAWRPGGLRPFSLSYHWLAAESRAMVRFNGIRTPLPYAVAAGEELTLLAHVQAPEQPGRYLLVWDLVQESAGWLSQSGTPVVEQQVEVVGTAAASKIAPPLPAEPAGTPKVLRSYPPPPDRGLLWRLALRLWQENPLIGIGPDVFRHIYGPLIGMQQFDDRVHTNNLYLELLVGGGVLLLLAWTALFSWVIWPALQTLSAYKEEDTTGVLGQTILIGCLLGLAAFLIHGLLDMFLEYTATYALLWLLVGMTVGLTERCRHIADSSAELVSRGT